MNIIQKAVRKTKDLALRRSETEILVRDATNNERWGPTGTELKQIAEKSFSYSDYADVVKTLWERLEDTGKNWRHIYKGLLVFDYLLKNGSDRFVQECRQRQFLIKTLQEFHHIDEEDKDVGVSIRARAKAIIELLNDEKRLKSERKIALKNKDKYKQAIGSESGFTGSRYSRSNNFSTDYSESESEEEEKPRRRRDVKKKEVSSSEEEDFSASDDETTNGNNRRNVVNNNSSSLFQEDQFNQQSTQEFDFFGSSSQPQQSFQSHNVFQPQQQYNQPQQNFQQQSKFQQQNTSSNQQMDNLLFRQSNTSFYNQTNIQTQQNDDSFFGSHQSNGNSNDDDWNDFTGSQQTSNFQSQPPQPIQPLQPVQLQSKTTQKQPSKSYEETDPWSNSSLIDLSNLGF